MSVNLGNDTKASSPVRTPEETKESKYEPKQNKKIIRLLTVIAYVISVSMAAIILSLYYVFLWDPKETYSPKDIFDPQNQSSVASMPDLISTPFSSGEGHAADVVNQSTSKVPDLAADHAANSGHNPPISTAGVNYHGQDDSSLQKSNAEQPPTRPQQDHSSQQHRRAQHHEQRGPPLTANA
ncbi:putative transmembrane protein INAFM2 isoform X2 [Penaeus vannamei]|uniref:putative transmembrane protein INAFM2 isoform X2 n=1 Tax=Penaeus vannamei TaxID=6689 RepID=UPI00387F8F5A